MDMFDAYITLGNCTQSASTMAGATRVACRARYLAGRHVPSRTNFVTSMPPVAVGYLGRDGADDLFELRSRKLR
jgi:hypothetical protein